MELKSATETFDNSEKFGIRFQIFPNFTPMIRRTASTKLLELATTFKCVAVTGARQTGKTTLVKAVFSSKPYVSLENPDTRRFAIDDPRGFLGSYPQGAILDEVQRVPELLSYLQEILDLSSEKGLFILTGSNNFLLQENISQTLSGRVAYLNLLPLTVQELSDANLLIDDDDLLMLNGFYPPIYDQQIPFTDWTLNYIRTYVEKDVRMIKNISNLDTFDRFVRLLAGRTGQELNYSTLSVDAGVDVKTVQSWTSVLESSFIIHLLRPHHKNFNKTLVKRPKIYFYDTALVCSLLGIRSELQLRTHPLRGAIFETMVVADLAKRRTNVGLPINLYYWRDKSGYEVDVIIEEAGVLYPVEIKSGKTILPSFFKSIQHWMNLSQSRSGEILYGGEISQSRSNGIKVLNWRAK
jgi:uncharacterized protein